MIERTVGIARGLVDRMRGRKQSALQATEKHIDIGLIKDAPLNWAAREWFQREFSLLELRNPKRYAQRLVSEIDATFSVVGNGELFHGYDYWTKFSEFPRMGDEELRTKAEAKERRHRMMSELRTAMDRTTDRESLVAKLNEWLSGDLDGEETVSVLNALQDHANLDTIHIIAGKQTKIPYMGFHPNEALVLISRHYERFKGDPALEGYLDQLTGLPKVVSAIREGKRLEIVHPPYATALAIEENVPSPKPPIRRIHTS